ncbi:MAG: decarboxylating 6-phosphogluconate dehydrogenase [Deltaproteobacteria bacterium]
MQLGMVGLGKMGMNMVRRLLQGGHEVVAYNRTYEKTKEIAKEGAKPSSSLAELVKELQPPRIVWLMLPAGRVVEEHLEEVMELLSSGDIVVEGGNSHYKDDKRRAKLLADRGIEYVDAGVSGGIWGLKVGYCTMVGGNRHVFEHLEPIFKTLAPPEGYLYCGPSGAGHFVKMVHNGIEYGMMEAYAEGFALIEGSEFGKGVNYSEVAHLWNQGSVIRSWLLELAEDAFGKDPLLTKIKGYVEDSGEGRWSVLHAVESGVPAPVITQALYERFASRQEDTFANRILAALRNEFGGHPVVRAEND